MRFRSLKVFVFAAVTFSSTLVLNAQQSVGSTPSVDSQAVTVLTRASAALQGSSPASDVTLTGSAHRIAGSDDEFGTATLKAVGSGASSVNFNFPSGVHSEVRDATGAIPKGNWVGPDGTSHSILFHNLLTEPVWFYPAFGIGRVLSAGTFSVTYVGLESRQGVSVHHITISQTDTDPKLASSFKTHLSIAEYYLDEKTLLPVALTYNTHPDDNAAVDIPVEIQFSDYRPVGTSQVPFRVQNLLNNVLCLDLQIQTVTFNAGLTAVAFNQRL